MKQTPILSEDYTAVLLAFLTIFVAILGVNPNLPSLAWDSKTSLMNLFSSVHSLLNLAYLFLFGLVTVVLAFLLLRISIHMGTFVGYAFIFMIAIVSQIITGNTWVKNLGLEIVLFSLLIGLFISNVIGVSGRIKGIVQTELYVKIGLVLLGCGIVFNDILQAGAKGLIQSVAVVIVVWQFSFWLCRRFHLEDEFRAMLSSAVAICGVSAAIATAGAINGDSKKLSYVISLVLITAIPMMLFMPHIAKALHMPDAVAGAWLGGTIDTTGAVVAAGKVLGDDALKYATVVKFSQNVLLGLAAFIISMYWTYTKNTSQERPSLKTIWDRFPKFVLGFIAASLLFSFVLSPQAVADVKSGLKGVQTFWFALAFICIGLETRFIDIFKLDNGRPAFAFLIAQMFNILFTLMIAWIVFEYLPF